ncbi:hypothetical protein [Francisella philomiragia]|uniref:hypothetical protein n=1 Tax=Francisella philomiragia TaxID=28110 RepID=UPI0019046A8D|nr:hypothetical protein [Francisella philomiragia]MBK2297314.1 hypothetical protein [Francisella philomiragia]
MEDYGIVEFERRETEKEVKQGYKYISLAIVDSIFENLKELHIHAHIREEYTEPDADDHYMLTAIQFTNKYNSFEELKNLINENLDVFYKLAEEGTSGYKQISKILNNNKSNEEEILNEAVKDNVDNFFLKRLNGEREDKRNYILISKVTYKEKETLRVLRVRRPEDYKNDGTDQKLLFEMDIKKAREANIDLKKIANKNISRIINIVEKNNDEIVKEQIEFIIAQGI